MGPAEPDPLHYRKNEGGNTGFNKGGPFVNTGLAEPDALF
jgi:hypothetical protein